MSSSNDSMLHRRRGGDTVADRDSLFRPEALEHYRRGRAEGDVLRVSPRWTVWAFLGLVLIFIAGVAYTCVGTIDEVASGPARVTGNKVVALLPAGYGTVLKDGMEMKVVVGGETTTGSVVEVGDLPLSPSAAERMLGRRLSSGEVISGELLAVRGELARPPAAGSNDLRAEIKVSSERIIFALVPGVKELVGD